MKKLKDKFNIKIDGTTHEVKRQMEDYYALIGETWVKLKIKQKGLEAHNGEIRRADDNKFLCWLPDGAIENTKTDES